MPKNGVLMRMFIDGPFGSAVRARWEDNATVVIFVAGSGVSFGLSILEYVCLCLAGRDGKHLGGRVGGWGRKGFATRRVRFVWLIREYGTLKDYLYFILFIPDNRSYSMVCIDPSSVHVHDPFSRPRCGYLCD